MVPTRSIQQSGVPYQMRRGDGGSSSGRSPLAGQPQVGRISGRHTVRRWGQHRSTLVRPSPWEFRYAVGPVDRSAADLADRHLGIGITEITADEVVGHHLRVAVAPTPACDEMENRRKITRQPPIP
jgi:hypothetical protein